MVMDMEIIKLETILMHSQIITTNGKILMEMDMEIIQMIVFILLVTALIMLLDVLMQMEMDMQIQMMISLMIQLKISIWTVMDMEKICLEIIPILVPANMELQL